MQDSNLARQLGSPAHAAACWTPQPRPQPSTKEVGSPRAPDGLAGGGGHGDVVIVVRAHVHGSDVAARLQESILGSVHQEVAQLRGAGSGACEAKRAPDKGGPVGAAAGGGPPRLRRMALHRVP